MPQLTQRDYKRLVKWIPVVVPMLAVLIVAAAYLVGSAVL